MEEDNNQENHEAQIVLIDARREIMESKKEPGVPAFPAMMPGRRGTHIGEGCFWFRPITGDR